MESAAIWFERYDADNDGPASREDAVPTDDRSVVFRQIPASFELAPGILCHPGGQDERAHRPAAPLIVISFDIGELAAVLSVSSDFPATLHASALRIVAGRRACERAFGYIPPEGRWHMPGDLRAIVAAIADNPPDGPVHDHYRRAKGLELICLALRHLRASTLLPSCGLHGFGEAQTHRIMKARTFIEERLHEHLTLDRIARACGLNRTQLTKGFRQLFETSVADFFTEARLRRARHLLLTTDLMVGTVAARCGYANNASFSRAYYRRFGISPTTATADMLGKLIMRLPAQRNLERTAEI